nr:hypothetical protein PU94_10910 [Coprobacter secundus]
MKTKILIFIFYSFCIITAKSQQMQIEKIWPNGPKELNGLTETINGKTTDIPQEALLYIYTPEKNKNNGKAVIFCPGGGYGGLAIDHEGHKFTQWLVNNGYTSIVLKYRLPNGNKNIPLADAQEALKIIRNKADELNIHPQKIGIAGFSAGGHLASTVGTHWSDTSVRPDFMILFYPVISTQKEYAHKGSFTNLLGTNFSESDRKAYSNDKRITPRTPETLLMLSDDDTTVVPMNSILFYEALKKNNVNATMYIFPEGKHGWGFNHQFRYHELMKTLLLDWLGRF